MVSPGIYSKLGVVFYIILQGDSLFLILEFIGALNAIYPAVGVPTVTFEWWNEEKCK